MNDLNSVLIEGNLTRDPVMAATPKGTPVCTFGLAANRYYRVDEEKQEEVSFFDVETWSRLAQRCGDELTKGRGVRVVGRLKQDRWTNKDGEPRSRVKIVAEHVEFKLARRPRDADATSDSDGVDAEDAAEAALTADVDEKEAAPVF